MLKPNFHHIFLSKKSLMRLIQASYITKQYTCVQAALSELVLTSTQKQYSYSYPDYLDFTGHVQFFVMLDFCVGIAF